MTHAEQCRDDPYKCGVRYALKVSSSEPYTLPSGVGLPEFIDEEIESGVELSASWGALTAGYSILRTKDGEGESIRVVHDDKCPTFSQVKCRVGVSFKETPAKTTRRYDASLSGELEFAPFKPTLTLAATHNATQTDSDTFAQLELKQPVKSFLKNDKLTLNLKLSTTYSFQDETQKDGWGAELEYKPAPSVIITVGYGSVAALNEDEELEVKRTGSATLKLMFD
jgi:hypothetical protein